MTPTVTNYRAFAWEFVWRMLQGKGSGCVSPFGLWELLAKVYPCALGMTEEEMSKLMQKATPCSAEELRDETELLAAQMAQHHGMEHSVGISTEGDALQLTSTIRFQGQWAQRFSDTTRTFFANGSKNTPMDIPFLRQENKHINLLRTPEAQSVTVPFCSEGDEPNFAMVFTMPRELPLDEYLREIDFSSPALMPSSGGDEYMELYLPSFSLENQTPGLIPALDAMGLNDALDRYCGDFHIDGKAMYIANATQHAKLKADAEGAAAEAITEILFELTKGMKNEEISLPIPIIFDRPFLFTLWQTSGDPLPIFAGTFRG